MERRETNPVKPSQQTDPLKKNLTRRKTVTEAKARLKKKHCKIVKDEPDFPRCYIQDPHGLIYNLTEGKRCRAGQPASFPQGVLSNKKAGHSDDGD